MKNVDIKDECCQEFEFLGEPDETGALIKHIKCGKLNFIAFEDLEEFKLQYPSTKTVSEYEQVDAPEYDLWDELLKEFPTICMYAPLQEPQRQEYIMKKLQNKYKISHAMN